MFKAMKQEMGKFFMKSSVLLGILQRLEAMTHTQSDTEVRRFELEGTEKCQVTYVKERDEFELRDSSTGDTFEFDDIDLVALEIYDILG